MRAKFLIVLLLGITFPGFAQMASIPASFEAKVIGIEDGDTIKVLYQGKPLVIRLAHIDCPEIKKQQPYANKARQFTASACFGKLVTVLNTGKTDRYRRLIGVVLYNRDQNLNKALVGAGLAWHFKKYSSDASYALLEQKARAARFGLWSEKEPIAPWNWRRPSSRVR
jgi:endonuclease YncB( thermonuclease family)